MSEKLHLMSYPLSCLQARAYSLLYKYEQTFVQTFHNDNDI